LRGRLSMEDNGRILAFETPDANGNAPLLARADQGATFTVDAEGRVESFVFRGNSGDRLFTRIVDSKDSELPSVDDILALRKTKLRRAALKERGGTKITGSVWAPQAGLRGTLIQYTQGVDQYAVHMDFGKFGRVSVAASGNQAWSHYALRGLNAMSGAELAHTLLGHPGAVNGDWNEYFDSIEVIGSDTVDGRPVYVVRLKKSSLPSRTYRIDAENGDVLRVNLIEIQRYSQVPAVVTYSAFEEIDGVRIAMKVKAENPASGTVILTFDNVESGLKLEESTFTLGESGSM